MTCCSVHSWNQPGLTSSYPLQGMLNGQELSEAYASADIFVMPSETETLGEHCACAAACLPALLQLHRGCLSVLSPTLYT